jgi:cyclic pyranopterin phosphate synthase
VDEIKSLSHIDQNGEARMVDTSAKVPSDRAAWAECLITVSEDLATLLHREDPRVTAKGSVFRIAELAGIMAAKRTAELIPLCHSLPLDCVQVSVSWCRSQANTIHITSSARTTSRTGVEMEALTAASIAALTVYDMCKAVTHEMNIIGPRLLEKTGGKSNVRRNSLVLESPSTTPQSTHPAKITSTLWGMILAGGRSTRMGQDKAWQRLGPGAPPAWRRLADLLQPWVDRCLVSCQADQAPLFEHEGAAVVIDPDQESKDSHSGPAQALAQALALLPEDNSTGLIVLACDLPLLNHEALEQLVGGRDPQALATFLCASPSSPEPLIAIWERRALPSLLSFLESGQSCPRQFLISVGAHAVVANDFAWILNANTPADWERACLLYRGNLSSQLMTTEKGCTH